VVEFPPTKEVGLRVTELNLGAFTVSVAFAVLVPTVALIVAGEAELTGTVETVNVAVLEPLGTVMFAGVVAAEIEELSVTTVPPEPAFAESVTVAVELLPPVTAVGERRKPETVTQGARQVAPISNPAIARTRCHPLASMPKERSTQHLTNATPRRTLNERRVSHPNQKTTDSTLGKTASHPHISPNGIAVYTRIKNSSDNERGAILIGLRQGTQTRTKTLRETRRFGPLEAGSTPR